MGHKGSNFFRESRNSETSVIGHDLVYRDSISTRVAAGKTSAKRDLSVLVGRGDGKCGQERTLYSRRIRRLEVPRDRDMYFIALIVKEARKEGELVGRFSRFWRGEEF